MQGGRGRVVSEAGIVWVLWASYGAFYFCRSNIAAAVPGIEAELELSKTQIGTILGSLKLAYGAGQLINGQLAERIRPRLLLALGMFGSAALNLLFGLGTGLYFLLFVWAANGYFQAMGWTPCMRVAANWFSPAQRGWAVSRIATGYLLAGGLVSVVAGYSAQVFGWRGAHIVPAIILAMVGVFMLIALREEPPDGHETSDGQAPVATAAIGWRKTLAVTLVNPRLWLIALALALVNACRYGFVDWGITHLMEVQGGGVGKSALKFAVLPIGGVVGALGAGWLSDRMGGRRAPVLVGFLLLLAAATILYDRAVTVSLPVSLALLAFIGMCVYGPQVLLVGSAAMDLARAGKSAAAVGFVNMFGYVGAFAGDQVTGGLADARGWGAVIYFWAGCALAAAVVMLPLWRHSARPTSTP